MQKKSSCTVKKESVENENEENAYGIHSSAQRSILKMYKKSFVDQVF